MQLSTQLTLSHDLTDFLRKKLHSLFSQLSEHEKCLYPSNDIAQLLNFLFDLKLKDKFLKPLNITRMVNFHFDDDSEDYEDVSTEPTVVFFLRPDVKSMRRVASMVLANKTRNVKKEYLLLLCPKKSFLCVDQLESQGILSDIKVKTFNFDLIPLQPDLLSLELDRPFYNIYVRQDQSIVSIVAQSILRLQSLMGCFEYTFAKGDLSCQVMKIVQSRYSDERFQKKQSQFDISFFVFDRNCDLVTPMLTPFSYQGLLDVCYPINMNQIEVPGELINQKQHEMHQYLIRHPSDETYPQVRAMYIDQAMQFLQEKCKYLKNNIKQAKQNDKNSLIQLKQLEQTKVKQYVFAQNHLSLCLHLSATIHRISFYNRLTMQTAMILTGASSIESIEEQTVFNTVQEILRFVSLGCSIQGGIKDKNYKQIQQIILRVYGIQHALTLRNMQLSGLIRPYTTRGNWMEIKSQFNLINENVDLQNPQDYSYVFIVYASLIARMVEDGLKDPQSWSQDRYALIKSATAHKKQKHFVIDRKNRRKLTFVYMIGGITYPEIQSLRFLQKKLKTDIVICTTDISNGSHLINQCIQKPDN